MTTIIVGGGSGTSFLASVMTASYLVSVFDSGGSTGILRSGTPAVGDVRKVLSALGANLEYRPGTHPVGNLLLQSRLNAGDTILESINHVRRMHNIASKVYPITLSDRHLVAEYDNVTLVGEHLIDTTTIHGNPLSVRLDQPARMCRVPKHTNVVIAPGDVWSSIIPNFLVEGFQDWVEGSNLILCVNNTQKIGETQGWDLARYVSTIEQYLGRRVDIIIADKNTEFIGDDPRLYTYDLQNRPELYKEAICKHTL